MFISRRKAIIILVAVAVTAASLAVITVSPIATAQGGQAGGEATYSVFGKALGAGLAVGLAGVGGGYAVGVAGASAMSAIAEKREVSGMGLLIVAMGEGIAIYGLLVAILLIFVIH